MKDANERFSTADEGNVVADLLCGALLLVWNIIRIPILIVLAFVEPFVRFVLTGIAVLSVVVGLVCKGSSMPPPIPFWVTLCVSLGCVMLIPAFAASRARRPRRFSFRSFDCLQIRCHRLFDTKQPRVAQQFAVLHALSLSRETQRFERNVQPELVSELEAIHHSPRRAVDP